MDPTDLAIYLNSLRLRTLAAQRSLRREHIFLRLCEASLVATATIIALALCL